MHRQIKTIAYLAGLRLKNPEAYSVIRWVLQKKLSYLDASALKDLYEGIQKLELGNQEGVIIEAGCALGGSALTITAAKAPKRHFFIYDTFEMIPPPSEHDGPDAHNRYEEIISGESSGIRGDPYYGYQKELLLKVKENFQDFGFLPDKHNVSFIQGRFVETLNVHEPVAFAHIDADWYESVMICLERIEPMLLPQGVLVIDDYSTWIGCRKAVDRYFSHMRDSFIFKEKVALHILKKSAQLN